MKFRIEGYVHTGEVDHVTKQVRAGALLMGDIVPLDDEARALHPDELERVARAELMKKIVARAA